MKFKFVFNPAVDRPNYDAEKMNAELTAFIKEADEIGRKITHRNRRTSLSLGNLYACIVFGKGGEYEGQYKLFKSKLDKNQRKILKEFFARSTFTLTEKEDFSMVMEGEAPLDRLQIQIIMNAVIDKYAKDWRKHWIYDDWIGR